MKRRSLRQVCDWIVVCVSPNPLYRFPIPNSTVLSFIPSHMICKSAFFLSTLSYNWNIDGESILVYTDGSLKDAAAAAAAAAPCFIL